ncbi:pectinesterase 3 [Mercurialis annua]|uniref:pectinesterase 3 n=1 Tax=Mercurialis annua TaxID=3986 RepID=UPI00215E7F87|nr:pectinesterase 3 [Mercurialis annua]
MESINILKGYDKVVDSNLENQKPHLHHSTTTRKPLIIIISSILILTLIIAAFLAALIHESNTEPPEFDSPTESLKAVCNITQYPTACFTSISSLNIPIKNDPESIFKISLHLSVQEISNISTIFKTLKDDNSQGSINDCLSLFDDALSKVNDSLLAMEKGLTSDKINDIQTWISAAMTDQETCVDGLEEMGSGVVGQVKAALVRCKEFLSNNLAIIANMQNLLEKFDLKLH